MVNIKRKGVAIIKTDKGSDRIVLKKLLRRIETLEKRVKEILINRE